MRGVRWEGRGRGAAALALALAAALLLCLLVAAASIAIYPVASGKKTYKGGGAVLDASNADQGYVMVRMQSAKKLKVRITGDREYTYDLDGDGEYDVYPLQDGSGSYRVVVYEQVRGNSYSQVLSKSIQASLGDENAAFLCPNRYCWYTQDGRIAALSEEVCAGRSGDREKVEAVYQYVTSSMTYDYMTAILAASGQLKGYVPNLEDVLERKMGICFDFAAMMCALLRAQGIPARLVMGYADEMYHAWSSVLVEGEWVRYDPTAAITFTDVKQYTEEAVY